MYKHFLPLIYLVLEVMKLEEDPRFERFIRAVFIGILSH